MKEEDAKEKWCPFGYFQNSEILQSGAIVSTQVNRWSPAKAGAKCLGSGCMAWISYRGEHLPEGRCGMVSR